MTNDPATRGARDWSLNDLVTMVANERPEGQSLEFKRDLPLGDNANGWRAKGRIHSTERDGIAREVTALANHYGGALVVGIDEAPDPPSRAATLADPLPHIFDLVDRMRDALASIIDPPIPGLDIVGIESVVASGAGYLVITVPASQRRPHGFGSPPQVYLRRDDNAVPASMQEISGMFWEARTNRERIERELQQSLETFGKFSPRGELTFQFALVSERPLSIQRLAVAMRSGQIIGNRGTISIWEPADAAEFPMNPYGWLPNATGVEFTCDERDRLRHAARWAIDEVGTLAVTAANNLYPAPNGEIKHLYPSWYAKTCGSLVGLAQLLSTWADYEGDWVIAGHFHGPERVFAENGDGRHSGQVVDLSSTQHIRPLRISAVPSHEELTVLSSKIWATFGLLMPDGDKSISNGHAQALQFAPARGA